MNLGILGLLLIANIAVADDWGIQSTPTPSLDEIFSYSTSVDISVGASILDAANDPTYTAPPDREYDEILRDRKIYDPENQPNYNPFIRKDSLTNTGSTSPNFNAFLGESLGREAMEIYQNVYGSDAVKAAAGLTSGSYFLNESTDVPGNIFLSR